ncbi:PREDICTED: 60S ribosomal protein L5-like [Amphimedon queenslandica]|uniref:Large ribosomal subunit protein uL18 C-terminal eukaryotes domain-containing protein n=1 Tax=Amphimedon queenslandica TaxID=400682 RepID=A0A1X7UF10_AMPQE|nr:PREDICTED: 60S ribosomal protein L5-like [Amphimedon queenslandica]|eukprot:XP_003388176.3 PREDICTED: 60S ribosomal protein L5-like [Amphimedon queenslandica]
MRYLSEEDNERYQKHFSAYIKEGLGPDDIEPMYKKAHEMIRADPVIQVKERKKMETQKRWTKQKLTLAQRKSKIKQKKASFLRQFKTDDDESED